MLSKSVLNKQQLNKPRPSELVVSCGEVSYKEYSGGLWQAVMWFSAAIAAGLILGSLFFNFAEAAEGPGGKRYFQIEPKNISMALNEFAMQADSEILFTPDIVAGKQTSGLTGEFTDDEALSKILAGSGLEYKQVDEKVFLVVDPETFEENSESYSTQKGSNDKRLIEEITVTATKRETSLQDTAMSITALGNEEIDRRGLVGMGDYLSSVPGVSVMDQAAGLTSVVMRGVALNPQFDGNGSGPTVGVYFDETPLSGFGYQSNHVDIKMVDLERVEVLRGPQGTLYGSSSLGGTVRNIPTQPNLQNFEGKFKAGYSNTANLGGGNSEFQGVINIPIIEDKLAIRAVGYRYENSGFYKNIGPNDPNISAAVDTWGAVAVEQDDMGGDEYIGGRISAIWRPVEELKVKMSYLHQDIDQDGQPQADLVLGTETYLQRRMQLRSRSGAPDYGEPEFNEEWGDNIDIANATIEYDLGWASILSSSSWVDNDIDRSIDLGPLFFGFIPWTLTQDVDKRAFIQEMRFASQFDGVFQFVGGLYYEDVDRTNPNWSLFGGDPLLNPFASQVELIRNTFDNVQKQKAVFGEVSYQWTEQVKLTLGARAFKYKKTDRETRVAGSFFPEAATIVSRSEESDVNYKAGIEYTPNQDSLLYASWSQGFRLGQSVPTETNPFCDQDGDGYYDGSAGITTDARQLKSDFVDSYEIGGKFTLLDRRLQINTDIYQINWDGIPITVTFETGCGAPQNAGKAQSQGAEFEGIYNISDNLLVNFGASYVKGELTEDAPSLGSIKGDRLPGSPKYNFNLGLQYDFYIANHNAFVRSDYFYVGDFYNNLKETGFELGSYGKWNARAGILFGQMSVELFGQNITNENDLTWVDSVITTTSIGYHLRPRTVGITVGYNF